MTHQLDARRLLCPLPVIRVQERVKQLQAGDILEIVCTDKGSLSDISAWCRIHGHALVSSHMQQREIFMTIQVGPFDPSQNTEIYLVRKESLLSNLKTYRKPKNCTRNPQFQNDGV